MPDDNPAKTVSARKFRRLVPVVLFGVLLVAGGLYGFFGMGSRTNAPAPAAVCETNPELRTKRLTTPRLTLETELAETQAQKYKGLSGRTCLGENQAMLFPYESAGTYCFVMREMNFPIDMIWLDSAKRIVTIKHEANPEGYPEESYCPDVPAQYVLEVSAGLAKRQGWDIGTEFSF